MNYYKTPTGEVYAYDDEQVAMGYPLDPMLPMTGDEVKAHLNIEPDYEGESRAWRDAELVRADIQLNKLQDGGRVQGTVGEWRKYRQALRDWPDAEAFPSSDGRPVAPDFK